MAAKSGSDRRWEAAAIVAILLGAAGLRLLRLASLPPGLHQDEAVYGVSAESILTFGPRIYYGEREPLFMYLTVVSMLILGPTPLALRVTSTLVGVIGVATGGALARQLFGRVVGLLTAAGLAASLWLTTISRVGYRAITFPTVECLGLALLWRATRTGRLRDYVLSGLVLGLTLYTYLSSRFLPIALFVFAGVMLGLNRRWLATHLAGLVTAGITAVIVCLPLGAYALRHPEMLFGRPDQVALPGGAAFWPAFADAVVRTLGMILVQGDRNWRQNLSLAPVFDPLNGLVFVVGLLGALGVAVRTPSKGAPGQDGRAHDPATIFTLVLLIVMLGPGMLSIDSPHYLRTAGAAVAIYALWALGLIRVVQAISQQTRRFLGRFQLPSLIRTTATTGEAPDGEVPMAEAALGSPLGKAILVALVLAAFVRTGWDYFVIYSGSPEVPAAFNADLAAAGRFLAASPDWATNRANLYVTDRYEQDRASVAFFLYPLLTPAQRASWLDPRTVGTFFAAKDTIPLPVAPSLYVVDGTGQPTLDALGPAIQRTEWMRDGGRLAGRAIWAVPTAPDWFGQPIDARYGRWLELERALVRDTTVGLRWKVLAIPPYQPSVYVHLQDRDGHTLATADQVLGLEVADWRVGQEIVTWHPLALPVGTPPGQFELTAGVYRKETGAREPAVQGGQPVAEVAIATLTRSAPVPGTVSVDHRIDLPVAPGLVLVGYDLPQTTVEAGTRVPLTLVWRATADPRADLTALLALRAPDGASVGAWRGPVGTPAYPSSRWPPGTSIRQILDLPVAPTAGGPATLVLSVEPGAASPLTLASLAITAAPHQFSAPRPRHPIDATFQGVGKLIGGDVPDRIVHPGETLPVTLYWRSLGTMDTSYTVFVHLLNPRNQVVSQRDEAPVQGTRPTTSWVPGEYLVDVHDLAIDATVPPGTYQIEVGLYDPRSGQRVATGTPDNRILIGLVEIQATESGGGSR